MALYRPVAERIRDFKAVEVGLSPDEIASRLSGCQDCGIPFCHAAGCALSHAIPEINAYARAGRWDSALSLLLNTHPFPEFTARICPALCEGSCVQALHGEAVPCRLIEREVIERGYASGRVLPRRRPSFDRRFRVGIVGSGPAGLAAAWRLARDGAQTTVYERDAAPGGFLRYGVPDFKLEKDVIDRRVELLSKEGVEFCFNAELGGDNGAKALAKRHDAIIWAGGARRRRDLAAPGRDLQGVRHALDFLTAQNRVLAGEAAMPPDLLARGCRVVVLGGGDTGADCVGTAWRQGAASVAQFEIMPEPPALRPSDNPWPQWPRVRRDSSSHAEGGERRWSVSTRAFLPADGDSARVGALDCAMVDWRSGSDGIKRPMPREGGEFVYPADLVLLAMGFVGAEDDPLLAELGLVIAPDGRVARNPEADAALPVYVAGDAAMGPSLAVRAAASGIAAAEAALAGGTKASMSRSGRWRGRSSIAV